MDPLFSGLTYMPFSEEVPADLCYFKHKKSAIMHRVKRDAQVAACGAVMGSNFVQLPRVLKVRWPKCLKCFPKDSSRIRTVDQMAEALDAAVQRSKRAAH